MKPRLKYRGRAIYDSDIAVIRTLIDDHREASRRELSRLLCQRWQWVQANGALCDMVCRSLMLALHRAGHIELLPGRGAHPNPLAVRRRPACPVVDTAPIT